MWPLERGHFWPKEHNLNKLGTRLLYDAKCTKYQNSRPSGFRQEDRLSFNLENLVLAHKTKICNGLELFEQLLIKAIWGSFLPNFERIQPDV